MDQTTSAHKAVLRNLGERSEDPNMNGSFMSVPVVIIKKRLNLDASLYTLLQIFLITLFEKIPLSRGFLDKAHGTDDDTSSN